MNMNILYENRSRAKASSCGNTLPADIMSINTPGWTSLSPFFTLSLLLLSLSFGLSLHCSRGHESEFQHIIHLTELKKGVLLSKPSSLFLFLLFVTVSNLTPWLSDVIKEETIPGIHCSRSFASCADRKMEGITSVWAPWGSPVTVGTHL